jgi:predicted nucleic acid-binding protein
MAVEYVLADTSVISHLTKVSPQSKAYNDMIGDRWLAVSFQTRPELLAADFGEARRQRIEDLLAVSLKLPHSEATDVQYSKIIPMRKELKRIRRPGGDAGEGDMWIIASALEHGLPLISHDEGQVDLGRAMGVKVLTNLPDLRNTNPIL